MEGYSLPKPRSTTPSSPSYQPTPVPKSDYNSTIVVRHSLSRSNDCQAVGGAGNTALAPWLLPILPSPPPSSDMSSIFSPLPGPSTTKTSVDSRFFPSSPEWTLSPEKSQLIARRLTGPSTSDGLGTIQEAPFERVKPTIETVERAAAARIYLETHFHSLLSQPTLREICRQHLESSLLNSDLFAEQKKNLWQAFNAQWSWHLRETRVLKAKSSRCARIEVSSSCADDFETLKLIGKGSFGVVKLVSEKPKPENSFRRQVYAMKVIRKSDMLKSTQEGHLRAERDLLVMAEGSNW